MKEARFAPVINSVFWEKMVEAGLVPPLVSRFVIDSGNPGDVVKIYYDCFADSEMLNATFDHLIKELPPKEQL